MAAFTFLLVVGLTLSSLFTTAVSKGNKTRNCHTCHGSRVVGGDYVRGSPLYVVAIENYNYRGDNWYHHCGGSILTTTVVLTACHCLTTSGWPRAESPLKDPRFVRVVAGVTNMRDYSGNRQTIPARALEKHPYCGMPYHNDVGVIILSRPLRFTPAVQPIRVFSRNYNVARAELQRLIAQNHLCYSGGWGGTGHAHGSQFLKVSKPRLINNQQCRHIIGYAAPYQICGRDPDSTNCQGDSGDALVCNGFIFGVTSNNAVPCRIGKPFVFADISSILYFANRYAQ